jgi:hypothetical protein
LPLASLHIAIGSVLPIFVPCVCFFKFLIVMVEL